MHLFIAPESSQFRLEIIIVHFGHQDKKTNEKTSRKQKTLPGSSQAWQINCFRGPQNHSIYFHACLFFALWCFALNKCFTRNGKWGFQDNTTFIVMTNIDMGFSMQKKNSILSIEKSKHKYSLYLNWYFFPDGPSNPWNG